MGNTPEHWAEWEVDPSTRSSVHLWTKYLPLNATVTTSGITLLTVSRGIPSVNKVTNPSFESSDLTMYTEIGTGTAPPDSGGRVAVSGDGEISAATFTADGIAGRAYVAKVTAAGNSAADSNGFYWTTGFEAGHAQYGNTIVGSCFVSSEQSSSAAGTVKMVIYNSTTGAVLATGDTITLTQSWQRASVKHFLPRGQAAAAYRVGIVAASAWAINTTPYYVDGFMVENRTDGQLGNYTDGAQTIDTGGATYEWDGTADASESLKKIGLSRVRGIRVVNEHATNPVYLCIDTDASTTNGIKIAGTETFETNWPIDADTKITAISTGGSAAIHGVVWGVHQN